MDFSMIFVLAIFTLGGLTLHAAYNKWQTRRLKRKGENPMPIPAIYQQHRDERKADITLK